MLIRGKILVIADGPAVMQHTLELLKLLQISGFNAVTAPTAYPGGALSFITELSLAAMGNHCTAIEKLTPEAMKEYETVVMAPVSLRVMDVFRHGKARELLEAARRNVIVAPVHLMNESEEDSQALQEWEEDLKENVRILSPEKEPVSLGKMGCLKVASPKRCLMAVEQALMKQSLKGKKVLITAGPTIEDIDPARFISNRSSGKMGLALAEAAVLRGAEVTVICGPVHIPVPEMESLAVIPVRSASQMNNAVVELAKKSDIAILCAAVADFTPNVYVEHKIKKGSEDNLSLLLKRTPDILAGLGAMEKPPFLVGFAAESDELELNAVHKLQRKHCNMLCANDISEPGCGFAVDTNRVTVYYKDGRKQPLELMEKNRLAGAIIEAVVTEFALNPNR